MNKFEKQFTMSPQFKQGMSVETWLDTYFSNHGFKIKRTTPEQERKLCLGDRIYSKGMTTKFVEYKSGIQTFYTGNIFLETVSVDTQNKPGWVYTCKASWVIYAALLNKTILWFDPVYLRSIIETLKTKHRVVSTHAQNATYKTWGVIVPLEKAKKLATKKHLSVSQTDNKYKCNRQIIQV